MSRITSRHTTRHHITWHHITPQHLTSFDMTCRNHPHCLTPRHRTNNHIIPSHLVTKHMTSYHITPQHIRITSMEAKLAAARRNKILVRASSWFVALRAFFWVYRIFHPWNMSGILASVWFPSNQANVRLKTWRTTVQCSGSSFHAPRWIFFMHPFNWTSTWLPQSDKASAPKQTIRMQMETAEKINSTWTVRLSWFEFLELPSSHCERRHLRHGHLSGCSGEVEIPKPWFTNKFFVAL